MRAVTCHLFRPSSGSQSYAIFVQGTWWAKSGTISTMFYVVDQTSHSLFFSHACVQILHPWICLQPLNVVDMSQKINPTAKC